MDEIMTPWGTVRYEGDVPTAKHQDILTAIAVVAKATSVDSVGRLHVLFDMADLRKVLRSDDWHWLKPKLEELVSCRINLKKPGSDWGKTRTILAGVDDSEFEAKRLPGQKKAMLKEIILSEIATLLIMEGMLVYLSDDVTKTILALKSQVSRSVARFCLSHTKDQVHKLETVLKAVGTGGGVRMARKYSAQLCKDADGLQKLGIEVSNKAVVYSRPKGVWFSANGWKT